ncbi:MAG: winged helix-turn-helix domain-containing protein [Candidatus Bathyarchaeia archaeon]
MGRHRRGEVQILTDILTLSMKGAKATHLMYKANLSFSTLRKYLDIALKRELLKKVCNDDGSIVYCITEKGKLLLEKLKDVRYVLQLN